MAIAWLNGIESDLQDDLRNNLAIIAVLPDRGSQEMFCQFFDLLVSKPGISLANRLQGTGFFIANRKGVITEQMTAFAVTLFHADHDNVEGGQLFFEFDPTSTAAPRRIEAVR